MRRYIIIQFSEETEIFQMERPVIHSIVQTSQLNKMVLRMFQ